MVNSGVGVRVSECASESDVGLMLFVDTLFGAEYDFAIG